MLEATERVRQRLRRGFTLIEVMIVVAILAILAAVALPAYNDYILRGRVTNAVTGVGGMESRMEQYFQDKHTYVGACAPATVAPKPANTNEFDFDCPILNANGYTVTATGKNSMLGLNYSMVYAGGVLTKSTTSVPTGWTLPLASCWALKKDGSC
jgi:type IV pilus assembly protein PilE